MDRGAPERHRLDAQGGGRMLKAHRVPKGDPHVSPVAPYLVAVPANRAGRRRSRGPARAAADSRRAWLARRPRRLPRPPARYLLLRELHPPRPDQTTRQHLVEPWL